MSFLKNILYSESYRKGMILSVGFNIFSKGLQFLVPLCIAFYFGSNAETDIYFYINTTVLIWVAYINNIDNAVLVPEIMRLRHQGDEVEHKRFINFFFYVYVLIGILGVTVLLVFNTQLYIAISRFSSTQIEEHRTIFLISSIYFLFLIIINYLVNILTSLKYFTLPMVLSAANSVIVILAIVIAHKQLGTTGIVIGATIAQFLNLMFLLVLMKTKLKWKFSDVPKFNAIRKKVWKDIVWVELGQVTAFVTGYLPVYLLSGYGGAITALTFGKTIADIPNSLLTNQYNFILGIKFNELYHKLKVKELGETFVKGGKILLLILIPVSCFFAFHSTEIVRLVYEHGSFNKADVQSTATFLSIFALATPLFAIGALITRLCFAAQRAKFIFFYQTISNVVLIAAILIAINYSAIYGYGYGYLAFNVLNIIGSYLVVKYILPELKYEQLLFYYTPVLLLFLAISTGLYALHLNRDNYLYFTLDLIIYCICLLYLSRNWVNLLIIKYKNKATF